MTIETKYNIGDEVWWQRGSTYKGGVVVYLQLSYEYNGRESGRVESYTIRGYDDTLYALYAEDLNPMNNEARKQL